ncbi:hypothetical protein SANA_06740 [Gottschalkiaceae bacterium SANA]|nr:hypothetical protein SANA_06740 [Gottschalkiaceae bacterium SANA]
MKIILLTGFLGAGKTTLLSRLLASRLEGRVGVVVNEFGDIGIDGRLIQDMGYQLSELNSGSIFCACLKSQFYTALEAMDDQGVEWLFVEASGLADPSSMQDAIQYLKGKKVNAMYHGAICMVDAVYFLDQMQILPVLERQIYYSDLVLLNKTDLQTERKLELVEAVLSKIQPDNQILRTQFCDVDLSQMLALLSHRGQESVANLNTWESRMQTVVIHDNGEHSIHAWKLFIESIAKETYRLKGFIRSSEGVYLVNGVGQTLRWEIAQHHEATEIVLFSAIGIRFVSRILEMAEKQGLNLRIGT